MSFASRMMVAAALVSAAGPPDVGVAKALWLDSSDNSSLGLSGADVLTWKEKVTARLMNSDAASVRPKRAAAGVYFPLQCIDFGVDVRSFLENAAGIPVGGNHYTVFMAGRWGNSSAAQSSLALLSGSAPDAINSGSGAPSPMVAAFSGAAPGSLQMLLTASSYSYTPTPPVPKGSRFLTEYVVSGPNGSDIILTYNGVDQVTGSGGTDGTAAATFHAVGAPDVLYASNGQLAELLVYPAVLTAPQKAAVRSYLKTKWALY